jgi:hypothetical protein
VALPAIAEPAERVAAAGFALAAASGICMIETNGTEYVGNPFLPIKFTAIAVGLLNAAVLRLLPGWKARADRALTAAELRQLAAAGGVSLAAWLTAIGAGRMIGYW